MEKLKKYAKIVFKSPIILIFVLICVFMLPNSINTLSLAFRSAIAVAVGIDINEENKTEIYVAINSSPTSESLAETNHIFCSSGETLGDAFANLNLTFGRDIKLGHTRFVMIGKKISGQDIEKLLDRLVRTSKMRNTVQLIYCPNSIKQMFEIGSKMGNTSGLKLSEIVCHQQNNSTTSIDSNVDSFYKGLLSPSGVSRLNVVSLTSDYTKGINANTDGTSGGESSSSGDQNEQNPSGNDKQDYVSNRGEIAIFKDGILQFTLNEEMSGGLNWLNNNFNSKELLVKVDNSSILKDALINFDILSKSVNCETFFYKNIPFVSVKIVLLLDIDEIISDNVKSDFNYSIIDDSVKSDIGRTIRSQIAKVANYAKQNKVDIYELNNMFYKNNYYDYINYLQTGKTKEDIIENTNLTVDIEIRIV